MQFIWSNIEALFLCQKLHIWNTFRYLRALMIFNSIKLTYDHNNQFKSNASYWYTRQKNDFLILHRFIKFSFVWVNLYGCQSFLNRTLLSNKNQKKINKTRTELPSFLIMINIRRNQVNKGENKYFTAQN